MFFRISDIDRTKLWGLPVIQEAVSGPPVVLGPVTPGNETQKWTFAQLTV